MKLLFLQLCFWGLSANSQIEERTYNSSDSLIDFQKYDSTKIVITIDTLNLTLQWDCYNLFSKTEYHLNCKILSKRIVIGDIDGLKYYSYKTEETETHHLGEYIIQADINIYILIPKAPTINEHDHYIIKGNGLTIIYL